MKSFSKIKLAVVRTYNHPDVLEACLSISTDPYLKDRIELMSIAEQPNADVILILGCNHSAEHYLYIYKAPLPPEQRFLYIDRLASHEIKDTITNFLHSQEHQV
jgi:hypothetical protein